MSLVKAFVTNLKQIHLILGIVYFVIFWLSGAFLKFVIWDVVAADDLLRVVSRSAHVYILMAALINIALSTYLVPTVIAKAQILQCVGSSLLLIAPLLLAYVFFIEPKIEIDVSGLTFLAVLLLGIGVILHLIASYMNSVHLSKTH